VSAACGDDAIAPARQIIAASPAARIIASSSSSEK
jgi:hypothetical protein